MKISLGLAAVSSHKTSTNKQATDLNSLLERAGLLVLAFRSLVSGGSLDHEALLSYVLHDPPRSNMITGMESSWLHISSSVLLYCYDMKASFHATSDFKDPNRKFCNHGTSKKKQTKGANNCRKRSGHQHQAETLQPGADERQPLRPWPEARLGKCGRKWPPC